MNERFDARSPGGDECLYTLDPNSPRLRGTRGIGFDLVEELAQAGTRVGQQAHGNWKRAPKLGRVYVKLDDPSASPRELPRVGDLFAGVAANEEHQVGLGQHAIGAFARVDARGAHSQRMVGREGLLGVERGDDREVQPLRQLEQFGARAGRAHAPAGHDDRPRGLRQFGQGRTDAGRVRLRPKGRHAAEWFFDDHVEIRLGVHDVAAGDAPEVEVGRARGA